jgi:hypothetical protein
LKGGFSVVMLSALCLSSGCAGSAYERQSNHAVFSDPASYIGKQVRVCGYIHDTFEDQNIWIDRRAMESDDGLGLGFMSNRKADTPSEWHQHTRCVTGEIVRTGCAEDAICSWSSFPYALKTAGTDKLTE